MKFKHSEIKAMLKSLAPWVPDEEWFEEVESKDWEFFKQAPLIVAQLLRDNEIMKHAIEQANICLAMGDNQGLSGRCVRLIKEALEKVKE